MMCVYVYVCPCVCLCVRFFCVCDLDAGRAGGHMLRSVGFLLEFELGGFEFGRPSSSAGG